MQIFIDTADINEIKEAVSWGMVSGITTNPKIVSCLEGKVSLKPRILEMVKLCDGPISVEVVSEDIGDMIKEAKKYASWHKNIVIKVPMGIEGLKLVKILEKDCDIRTNVTAVMATNQAILAALSGATYVSVFFARIGDMGYEATQVIKETSDLLKKSGIKSKIISGSIRHIMDVNRSFLAGADIVTVPFKFLKQMSRNPRTEESIAEFNSAWKEMKDKGLLICD